MPELPEVETVRRTLEPVLGFVITEVRASRLPLRGRPIDRPALAAALKGATIAALRRFGKYLLLDVEGGRGDKSLLVHLGMSGRFRAMASEAPEPPHTHLTLGLTRAKSRVLLRFSDPRRFGQLDLVERANPRSHPSLASLGPDPLVDGVDAAAFAARGKGAARAVKAFLLDQSVLAGVGNIYASEALWQAGILPSARTERLSRARLESLAAAVPEVFHRALEHGGTSLKDFVDADGHAGDHASYLWVYDREGQPCRRRSCKGHIRRTILQGRATFHCPRCQRS